MLSALRRFESTHLPFLFLRRLMGILGAGVEVLILSLEEAPVRQHPVLHSDAVFRVAPHRAAPAQLANRALARQSGG